MTFVTEEQFKIAVGCEPEDDDMERVNCPNAGDALHTMCGWCERHNLPRFCCGCTYDKQADKWLI